MIGKYPREAKYTKATRRLLDKDAEFISPSYTRDYPFIVTKGIGREVVDIEGNKYLDFGAGIATTSTGHCHPKVVWAIKNHASDLIHMSGTDFYYEQQIKLAEKMAHISTVCENGGIDGIWRKVFFGNSGAEAVEAGMKLARFHTQRPAFVAFTGAFHGRTLGALSLTGSKAIQRKHYQPLQPVTHVPYPNCYDCPLGTNRQRCEDNGAVCIDYIDSEVFGRTLDAEDCAAIFVEPIQGEGGYIVPPNFWWKDLDALAKMHNVLVAVDEVQAGMGRTGKWFAHHHVTLDNGNFIPDIITSAKGIASGMPVSAMIADADIMSGWPPGSHASTFGGNPVCCAAALATIEVIEEEGLLENAETVGQHLGKMLEMLERAKPIFDNPRGVGLMRAIDLPGENRKGALRDQFLMACFRKGLILLGCGAKGIRFCPALNVTTEEVNKCVTIMEDTINEIM
jgi:4-aminobutyrate aminotransferase